MTVAEGTELGLQVAPILASGELVPDELTIALIRDRLAQDDAVRGFILDGFPRNLVQAEALDEMLGAIGRPLDSVLFFDLDDDTGDAVDGRGPCVHRTGEPVGQGTRDLLTRPRSARRRRRRGTAGRRRPRSRWPARPASRGPRRRGRA